jgi:hypothetical protein
MRRPPCSCSHSAIVRLAPKEVPQVHSECCLPLPLTWMAQMVGS